MSNSIECVASELSKAGKIGIAFRPSDHGANDVFRYDWCATHMVTMCVVLADRNGVMQSVRLRPRTERSRVAWATQSLCRPLVSTSNADQRFGRLARALANHMSGQLPTESITLPELWFGFENLPVPVPGPTVTAYAVERAGMTMEEFRALGPGAQYRRVAAAWGEVCVGPRDPSNNTGRWLVPGPEGCSVPGGTPYLNMGPLRGVQLRVKPGAELIRPRQMQRDLLAWWGIPRSVSDVEAVAAWEAGVQSLEESQIPQAIADGLARVRKVLGGQSSLYSDEALLSHMDGSSKFLVPDAPVEDCMPALVASMQPVLREMCSPQDLAEVLRDPLRPIYASNACKMQVVAAASCAGGKIASLSGDYVHVQLPGEEWSR